MALILKSNQISTKNIGNIFDINVEGYSTVLDFELEIYKNMEGGVLVKKNISDVISTTRSTKAMVFDGENYNEIAANAPKIHIDPITSTKGLLIETSEDNLFLNPYTATTQTINVNRDGGSNNWYHLFVEGAGSATFTTGDEIIKAESIDGSPATVKVNQGSGSLGLNITIVGNPQYVVLIRAFSAFAEYRSVRHADGVKVTAGDSIKLLPLVNNTNATILMQFEAANIINTPLANTVLNIKNSASSGGLSFKRQKNLSGIPTAIVGEFVNTNDQLSQNIYKPTDANRLVNMIFAFDQIKKNKVLVYNGMLFENNNDYVFNHNEVYLGTNNFFSGASNLNGILKKVVVWDRKLNNDELLSL